MTPFETICSGTAPVVPARRIVSLVPSLTELLHHLGLEQETVGITRFCIHPKTWHQQKKRVGGTKDVKVAEVLALQPDWVIASKEENVETQVRGIADQVPVLLTDIQHLEDAIAVIRRVGEISGKQKLAAELAGNISTAFRELPPVSERKQAVYFIWHQPWMVAGGDTFIHDMLRRAGFENAFGHLNRYPAVTLEAVKAARPDILLLSSEPYPFRQKHLDALKQEFPEAAVRLVDGEMFSWYGSRMLQAPAYFAALHTGG